MTFERFKVHVSRVQPGLNAPDVRVHFIDRITPMKTSLLAVALLGACAGAAHAQTSVQVYGNLDAGIVKRSSQNVSIGKR